MYTVVVNGVPIQCETAEQAIELARQAGGDGTQRAGASSRNARHVDAGSRWTDRRVRDFLGRLGGQQRKLIDALLAAPDGAMDHQLRTALGVQSNNQLGGVFTGVSRHAKATGADPKDLYSTEQVPIGDEVHYEYKLTDSFRGAVERVGV